MGFKYKTLTFTLGDTDFPVGTTSEAILQKEQTIVKTVAQAIINMGIGWKLDSRCSSMTDFKPLPDAYYNEQRNTVLFLRNTISRCKMLLGYCLGNCNKGVDLSSSLYVNTYNSSYTSSSGCVAGIVMSMIPGESSDEFGTTPSDLIPASATRLTGTFTVSGASSQPLLTVANVNESAGAWWYYGILATEYVVGIILDDIGNALWPRCFCGRILSNVSHSSDTDASAKYGTVSFKVVNTYIEFEQSWPNATSGETVYTANGYNTNPAYGSVNGQLSSSLDFSNKACYACGGNSVRTASGTWVSNTAHTGVILRKDNFMTMSSQNHRDDNSLRWSAFHIVIISDDLSTYGVVPGDGVKGILDPNLFRSANATSKQLYGNGTFIGIHESLLLGWDPSNETPLGT